MYLYLDNERVVMGEWIVDVISFQKIFGLWGLECHLVEIWRDVTLVHGRNMKIGLEFWKQNSQYELCVRLMEIKFSHVC